MKMKDNGGRPSQARIACGSDRRSRGLRASIIGLFSDVDLLKSQKEGFVVEQTSWMNTVKAAERRKDEKDEGRSTENGGGAGGFWTIFGGKKKNTTESSSKSVSSEESN